MGGNRSSRPGKRGEQGSSLIYVILSITLLSVFSLSLIHICIINRIIRKRTAQPYGRGGPSASAHVPGRPAGGGGGNSGHVLHARTYSISTATMDSDWMGHMI